MTGTSKDSRETFVPKDIGERILLEVLAVPPEEILELRAEWEKEQQQKKSG